MIINNTNRQFKCHQIEISLGLSKGCILLYLCLCRAADKDGISSPSVANMEIDTGIARRSIFRNLLTLKSNGLIRQEGEKDGVTVYRVTRRNSFVLLPYDTLQILSPLTKGTIIKELTKMSPPKQKNVTPKQENDTPKEEKMSPIIDNITNNYNSIVNVKEKVSPPKNVTPPQCLTITEFNAFNALWDRWSASPVSKWTSPDPVTEFVKIVKSNATVLKNKDLTTELCVLDAYLLELRYKRLNSFDSEYKGSPIIYHGKGWIKCIDRWLSSKKPASITEKRRAIISRYGITFVKSQTPSNTAPKQQSTQKPVESSRIDSDEATYVSTAKQTLEAFTGCNMERQWLQYIVRKEAQFPIYEERANYIMRDAMNFTASQIEFIESKPSLIDLAILVSLRPSNAQMFYSVEELSKYGLT